MKSWAQNEMLTLDLGDARLNKRCITILDAITALPEASFPAAMTTTAGTKATYRFLSNEQVRPDALLAAHFSRTQQRCLPYPHILALQDTTTLNYSSHGHTQGLGYLGDPLCQGLFVHSVLMCSASGIPLGLAYQEVWARPNSDRGKKKLAKGKPIEEKESFRWLKALQAVNTAFPEAPEVTVLSDQESDIFDYFWLPRPENIHLLFRAHYNRSTPEGKLRSTLEQRPAAGRFEVELPRHDTQARRSACLEVRFGCFQVLPPQQYRGNHALKPVVLYAVLAQEVSVPPKGRAPIRWFLLTTRPVTSFDEAQGCIALYTCRWLIERYHYVLKSGCQLEALQLSTRDRLERAVSLYSIAGWRLLWMTYLARQAPETSCEEVFEPYEWQALHGFIHPKVSLPPRAPTIRVVVRWIAQLGGFLNRKGDGEPGVKVIWRGLAKLEMISQTWLRLQQNPHLIRDSGDVGNE